MKKIITFLFCIGFLFKGFGQDKISEIDTLNDLKILDGKLVGELNLAPGKHRVKILDFKPTNKVVSSYYQPFDILNYISFDYQTIVLNYTIKQDKQYAVNFFTTNFYDSINSNLYFNHNLPQIIEKNTSQVVSYIEYPIIFEPYKDSTGILHLYYSDKILDDKQLALIQIPVIPKTSESSFLLTGWTYDNNIFSYFNPKEQNTAIKAYIKTGYYKAEHNRTSEEFYISDRSVYCYSFYFLAESNSFINLRGFSSFAPRSGDLFYIINDLDENSNIWQFSMKKDGVDKPLKSLRSTNLTNILFLPDGQHGWIIGEDSVIISTKNSGKTWKLIQQGKNIRGAYLSENYYNKNKWGM